MLQPISTTSQALIHFSYIHQLNELQIIPPISKIVLFISKMFLAKG